MTATVRAIRFYNVQKTITQQQNETKLMSFQPILSEIRGASEIFRRHSATCIEKFQYLHTTERSNADAFKQHRALLKSSKFVL